MVRRLVAAVVGLAAVLCGCSVISEQLGPASAAGLRVVVVLPAVPGYDRSCSRGHACVFGPAWADVASPGAPLDGCDQRNQTLRRQLTEVRIKSRTNGCVVEFGMLDDPYTGARVVYRRGDPARLVEVDHVVPLAGAWDRGAATWTMQQRRNFAGDLRNLVVTTAAANRAKSDKPPADWSPATARGRCLYARQYLQVSVAYDLAATHADVRALDRLLRAC
jgi:hypothetical protein